MAEIQTEKPSKLWYLVPIVFGLIGGLVSYIVIKDSDKEMARNMIIVGIVMAVVPFLLIFGILLFFYIFAALVP